MTRLSPQHERAEQQELQRHSGSIASLDLLILPDPPVPTEDFGDRWDGPAEDDDLEFSGPIDPDSQGGKTSDETPARVESPIGGNTSRWWTVDEAAFGDAFERAMVSSTVFQLDGGDAISEFRELGAFFETPSPSETETAALVERLLDLLSDSPVEAGATHPAEQELERVPPPARSRAFIGVRADWDDLDERVKGDFLILVGRVDAPELRDVLGLLCGEVLHTAQLGLRESAIHALELLGDESALSVLRRHQDSDPVLRDYVQRVVRDLES